MSILNRRHFLGGAAATSLLGAQQRPNPNIVFIMLDDLGYGDFGCYGQKLIETPNVDRAAAEGLRFTDCYAGAAVCAPSRAVLMTGLHGGHAPIRANAGTAPIEANDVTVAEQLRKAGYATGGFGKWGLGDAGTTGAPTRQGFDEFFGYLHQVHAHSYYPSSCGTTSANSSFRGTGAGSRLSIPPTSSPSVPWIFCAGTRIGPSSCMGVTPSRIHDSRRRTSSLIATERGVMDRKRTPR